jgi:polyisoprenoid-binding protein YceI
LPYLYQIKKGMKKNILILAILIFASAFSFLVTDWSIVPGTKAGFKIRGPFGKTVNGTMDIINSVIKFDPQNPASASISATAGVSSIDTRTKKRDNHLRSADFFDAAKYPEITFKSTSIEKTGEGKFIANGNLKIKEVTKQITIPFDFTQNGNEGKFSGTFAINRLDYGVGKKSRMMGNEVVISLNIPVKVTESQ